MNYPQTPIIILDQDWAPDFVIEEVMGLFEKHQIKSTWFITHQSPILDEFQKAPNLFEMGIHPNFLPGSTHGQRTEEIISHCLSILPEAKCMRTHAYMQSSLIYAYISNHTSIKLDASVFLPHVPNLQPFPYWAGKNAIVRTPVYWEDDNEMKIPGNTWDINRIPFIENGLKIFAFHPIHIYLNTPTLSAYIKIKQTIPDINAATQKDLEPFRQKTISGVREFFTALLRTISENEQSFTISELLSEQKGLLNE